MRPRSSLFGPPRSRSASLITAAVCLFVVCAVIPVARGSVASGGASLYLPQIEFMTATDSRFGAVVAGTTAAQAINSLGITWWYSYGVPSPSNIGDGVAQISLRPDGVNLSQVPAATLQANARQYPGGYWIIGNEPNVPGQDNVTADYYATQLEYYVTTIKAADPTARIVGPNVLNWDSTCSGCNGGFTSGHTWVDSLRAAWATQYGGEPPFDVWSLHSYQIAWDHPPMTDTSTVEQQISSFANYLAVIPADAATPIWLTEFGVIWGFDGWTTATSGCAAAPSCVAPVGAFDDAAVSTYLSSLLSWLTANSAQYRLERWFLYTTVGSPEPYATTFGGISLLANSALTSFGQTYRQAAQPIGAANRNGGSAAAAVGPARETVLPDPATSRALAGGSSR